MKTNNKCRELKCVGTKGEEGNFTIGKEYKVAYHDVSPGRMPYYINDDDGNMLWVRNYNFELKEKEMKNEMPKLEAGMYFKCGNKKYVSVNPRIEHGDLYGCIEIVADTFSDGNSGPICGVTYSVTLESVTEVFKTCTHKIAMCPDQWREVVWQKESATDKAIRDLKDSQANANADFEAKIKALEETVK